MKVKDFHKNKDSIDLNIIQNNSSVEDVYNTMISDKKSRVVYVVDGNKKLVGHISIGTLINLYGAKFASGPIDVLTSFSKLLAHKASDLMTSPVYVRMDNHIKIAIKVMMESSIFEIPIVNDQNQIIGAVTCFELLETLKEHPGGE